MDTSTMMPGGADELLRCLDRLHTTPLGALRITKNLALCTEDPVGWCRDKIRDPEAVIERRGKNWYIDTADSIITVNARSLTVITAHKKE